MRKIIALFLAVVTVACLFCGCSVKKEKSDATLPAESAVQTATPSPETGNEVAITIAGIDIDNIKVDDKVSVFTVKSVDIKKNESGAISSAEIIFTGSLAVRGTYSISEDGKCFYAFTDEYKEFLPFPNGAGDAVKGFGIDATKIREIFGEANEGTAAIVIEEYTLIYSENDGGWMASVGSFEKDENEYAIMQ